METPGTKLLDGQDRPETHSRLPYLHLLQCPRCHQKGLLQGSEGLYCQSCARQYEVEDGIPLLFWPNDAQDDSEKITEIVRSFYEENPFPDYEDTDDLAQLIEKAQLGLFAHLLDLQIPYGARVLECGCGTGQLSNFLGIAHRTVFGTDICLNSLRLANGFKVKHRLDRVHFLQMNLFQPIFEEGTFDFVISNGVLHSTFDPYRGFQTISRLVKPGGYLIIGLYHRFGRLATDLRRLLFRHTGQRFAFLDPRLRSGELGRNRQRAWFADQYLHPHELKYTIGEIIRWLEPNSLELVKTLPKTRFSSRFSPNEKLFEPELPGGTLQRTLLELSLMFRDDREGGFFTVISRRKP